MAIQALDAHLAANPADADEAHYLKALALYYDNQHAAAAEAADQVIQGFKESSWLSKASFLKAQALVQQKKFKEAEEIYENEAFRLLSKTRKHEIAGVYIRFADALAEKPDPHDVGAPPPDYSKAHQLYQRAMEMEIGREIRDDVQFKMARALQLAGNPGGAISAFQAYLQEFDPDWTGVAAGGGFQVSKRENPPPAGKHAYPARQYLAEAYLASGQLIVARQVLEDLLVLLGKASPAPDRLAGDSLWLIVQTYQFPNPRVQELELAGRSVREFLKRYPRHYRSVEASYGLGESYRAQGRSDLAIAAYEDFISGKNFDLPEGEEATRRDEATGKSPAELRAEWKMQAVFQIGEIRFAQKQYEEAIKTWKRYIIQFPNGPHWAASQEGVIHAELNLGLDAVSSRNYDQARRFFDEFLQKHPLEPRARQVLFILGQIHYSEAQKMEESRSPSPDVEAEYRRAVQEWTKLVSKCPGTEESSLALYRIGLIYEEKLADLEEALASFRRLTWGSSAPAAAARIAVMTQKQLAMATERRFGTNEPARVRLSVRNIEKLTFKQYRLDLEAYFRKTHGIGGVENLDIALIQPDRTWEVKMDGYARYKPLQQEVEIPFEGNTAGACVVNASEEDWEATALVLRSDLDIILKSSRRELLVFAEDMQRKQAAEGVDVLLSDGQKIFGTGKTGHDGVFRGKFGELQNLNDLRVFAFRGGSIASNVVTLSGLGFSRGLSPKGYLYTDRPAYRPGQRVSFRGIIRDVVNGAYAVPQAAVFLVQVSDPQGRTLWEEEKRLSEFGTFHAQAGIDPASPLGVYTVIARRKDNPGITYSCQFLVQQFQLEKMRLKIDFPRQVYFRGEEVAAEVTAEYYWGQPVSEKPVRYTLPDGRSFSGKTDDRGKLKFSFDTTGMMPGSALPFSASLEGENVSARRSVFLAQLGFNLAVSASQELVLSGEPFHVTVKATDPEGKPTAQDLTLFVLRTQPPKPDPVLSAAPWLPAPAMTSSEVTVSEHKLKTDPTTGTAAQKLELEKGGRYVLRAAGPDRFGQTVTGEAAVTLSDAEDETRLRFFAEASRLPVGGEADLRLHSRLDSGLALITTEGEEIIRHEITEIQKGYNGLRFTIGHEHFPNFRVAVSVMDGRALRTAAKEFSVERELKVTIKPAQEAYRPGEDGQADLTVTDQLGKPVKVELSLAVVDEALLALFPDTTPKILDFFQEGARRQAEMRTESTCAFLYTGVTRKVIKAYLEESERLALMAREEEQLGAAKNALSDVSEVAAFAKASGAAPAAPGMVSNKKGMDQLRARGQMANRMEKAKSEGKADRDAAGRRALKEAERGEADEMADDDLGGEPEKETGESPARREMPEAGLWLPAIVTDDAGKALVILPMPENTTLWRLTARGCSAETLVGEATAQTLTRKDFFVEIKSPGTLQEGDRVRIHARVHNLTDYEGPASLALTLTGGKEPVRLVQQALVKKQSSTEALFDAAVIPAALQMTLEVRVQAGPHQDALVRSLPIRPWGIEYAGHAGGTATGDASATLELPPGQKYTSTWMTLSVGPSLRRAVLDLALGNLPVPRHAEDGKRSLTADALVPLPPTRWDGFVGSELLAVVGGLEYARAVQATPEDQRRLVERARALVSGLVVSQLPDGGWSWSPQSNAADWAVTSVTFWALSRCRQAGVAVHPDSLQRAQGFLNQAFQRAAATDNDSKAAILHALSTANAADFAHVNRLHRERNNLSAPALAYTALSFANAGRNELAGEVLDVLEARAKSTPVDNRPVCYWEGAASHPWLNDSIETTALTLLALARVRPQSPNAKAAAEFLLHHRGCGGFAPAKAHGPAVAALAAYFGQAQYAPTDSRITVQVNGRPLRTLENRGEQPTVLLAVPAEMIQEGRNLVEFKLEGRGEYAYAATLWGFSPDLKDPASWAHPYVVQRHYFHAPLEYRGLPLPNAPSTSPVHKLEIGQRAHVLLDLYETGYNGYLVLEEPLPAGTMLVDGSLAGNFTHFDVDQSRIRIHFPPGHYLQDLRYQLVGYASGDYRVLPTVLRDAVNPGRMRVGPSAQIGVMQPGETSSDPYAMNDAERYALGEAYFRDGRYDDALRYLAELFQRNRTYSEREVARMLLWIYTSEGYYDARRIVERFEVLRERYPDLYIPFDKILLVGKAYRDIGEFERAGLVFRATIDASFLNDSNVSAVLQDEGQFLASVDYQHGLWREYPDTAEVVSAYFGLSQALYQQAAQAQLLARKEKEVALSRGPKPAAAAKPRIPNRIEMLKETLQMLSTFVTLYPGNPLADDAAFSMANGFLDLKDYATVVRLSETFQPRYEKSPFTSSFQYMVALGHFWQRHDEDALKAALTVANGDSRDRDFARYIVGQIYHAGGKPEEAIRWYDTVKHLYSDAQEAIQYFAEKRIGLDEVSVFRPGQPVGLKLKYRNLKDAFLQVYRVDLMKLYLREKNLTNVTKVSLAGIKPEAEQTVKLGEGRDYGDREKVADLPLKNEGAYLIICRGEDLFASGLVLITPLKIEVQEDPLSGRVRANVLDAVKGGYSANIHVKAIGSEDTEFRGGETDLRGLFIADNLRGKATVIARHGDSRYAFYRGEQWLGQPGPAGGQPQPPPSPRPSHDYESNLRDSLRSLQQQNVQQFDQLRRTRSGGVQVQKAL
ncbi:MAG: tetratricopeptide repeat protein [Planctomycetes bacterium]|nr:tetratricopeptide repeat protein [Planctomycetota bacterium]